MEIPPPDKEKKKEIPFRMSFTINELVSEDIVGPDGKVENARILSIFEKGELALRKDLRLDRERLKTDGLALEYDIPEMKFLKDLFLFDEIKVVMYAHLAEDKVVFSGKILRGDDIIAEYKKDTALVSSTTKAKVELPDWLKDLF